MKRSVEAQQVEAGAVGEGGALVGGHDAVRNRIGKIGLAARPPVRGRDQRHAAPARVAVRRRRRLAQTPARPGVGEAGVVEIVQRRDHPTLAKIGAVVVRRPHRLDPHPPDLLQAPRRRGHDAPATAPPGDERRRVVPVVDRALQVADTHVGLAQHPQEILKPPIAAIGRKPVLNQQIADHRNSHPGHRHAERSFRTARFMIASLS